MSGDIKRRGLMLVLSSPSGAGKTTISRSLLARDAELMLSVSATTRPMRPGEVDGKDYVFVTAEKFEAMAAAGQFLEHAKVFDHYYGTPAEPGPTAEDTSDPPPDPDQQTDGDSSRPIVGSISSRRSSSSG